MLRTLTVLQHILFVVLTGIGFARALADGAPPLLLVPATLAFLGWYAAGVRSARRRTGHTPAGPDASEDTEGRRGGAGMPAWWLLGLSAGWLLLVLISPEHVWIAFSLWLLAGHFLPWRWAVPYTLATLAVVVLAPWRDSGGLTVAEVLGPAIGAAFALVASRAQVELVRDSIERQRLIADLVRAQAEAEALSGELAATQRDSGVLAERARLSRDIHDTLAQGFSSIVLLARAGAVTPGEDSVRELLRRIDATASDNLEEARRVVGALAPRDLQAGLPASLRRLLDTFGAESGIHTELRLDGELDGLPTAVEVALVRTAQGALANVRNHSKAGRVVVSLTGHDDSVRLDIVDDGVGFAPAARSTRSLAATAGGYGLPSTRARLRELGGGLEIESAPGDGTALSAYLPLGGVAP